MGAQDQAMSIVGLLVVAILFVVLLKLLNVI